MRFFVLLSIVVLSCVGCEQQPPASHDTRSNGAIFVLIENGGTIAEEDQDDLLNTALHLLQQITGLAHRKASRNTQVHILFSASPNRIMWSGTPQQLLEQAEEVKNLIVFKPSFSDLVMAFEEIKTTIDLTQPDSIRLYWIGSTIHVPFQASHDDSAIEVKVPQEVPANLALASFVDRLSVLKIMHVHPDQDQVLQAYLASLGVLTRAKAGEIDFALLGKAQTRSRLNALL